MKKHTLKFLFRKVLRKYFKALILFTKEAKILEGIKKIEEQANLIFIFPLPGSPWGYMFQRPQQIARALTQRGHVVIYCVSEDFVEEPDWSIRGLLEIEPRLYLFNDGSKGKTLKSISKEKIIWQYWPQQNTTIKQYSNELDFYIYDCIDHLTTFIQYDEIEKDYEESLKRANLILATSVFLYEELRKNDYKVELVPNGVNYEDFHFEGAELSESSYILKTLKHLSDEGKVLIGYYGAIAEWMNFEWLIYSAKQNPEWEIILIGQVYPGVQFEKVKNIKIFDRVDYTELKHILKMFDVAIIPFKINDITINTSPVKMFEYMAGGKPIVSSDLPEIKQYENIFISTDEKSFEQNIHLAISKKNDLDYLESLKETAKKNTWNQRIDWVEHLLSERGRL